MITASPGWLSDRDVAFAMGALGHLCPTTVRGAFSMTPAEDLCRALPTVAKWLNRQSPYGAYVLRYGVGECKPEHTDTGIAHERFVCLLQRATVGGGLYVGATWAPLASPGDAVFFRADLVAHTIEPVIEGERIVLTAGRAV